jgi:diguanylate cyclase (GGDEF)-like protein
MAAALAWALICLPTAGPAHGVEAFDDEPKGALTIDGDPAVPMVGDGSDLAGQPLVMRTGIDGTTALAADRVLLAIDALSELDAFERGFQPSADALIGEIRDSIPGDGMRPADYISELEQFVADVVPFLELLETSGVPVSDDLWIAVDELEFVGLEPGGLDTGNTAFLAPDPWVDGLGDLLLRGGASGPMTARSGDAEAIRSALAQFQIFDAPPEPGGQNPKSGSIDNTTTTLLIPASAGESPSDNPPSTVVLSLIVGGILLAVASTAGFLLRRRSRRTPASASSPTDGRGSGSSSKLESSVEAAASTPSVADLLDASRRMTSSLNISSVADIALAEARRLVDAEGGIVVRRSDDALDPLSCEPPMLFNYDHLTDGCLPRVIDTGRSTTSIATAEPWLVEVPMAMAAVPIVADGVVSGAILVVRVSSRPFTRDELDSLEMLAPLVGSAFAAALTHESATELADIEPLTGLQNRRRLDLDLASISADDQVAYVMVDIDHFKNFNDTNGHAAGDEALRQVSALLSDAVRPRDLVYRYGGEEFCILLPGATSAQAVEVAERARSAVEAAHIPGMESQPDGRVTISVGVSDSAWGTPADLADRADAALYEAKRNGRNQVALHQP